MDDYNGRINFLAAVCGALLLYVVMYGFSRHDSGQNSAVNTASMVVPVRLLAK